MEVKEDKVNLPAVQFIHSLSFIHVTFTVFKEIIKNTQG